MKRILKKNQIIITTLAVMIAIAGYLNYSGRILDEEVDAVSTDDNLVLVTDGEVQENTYVDTTADIVSMDQDLEDDLTASAQNQEGSGAAVGEAVLANARAGDNLIAAAKLNREQVRAKSKETLLEVINNTSIEEAQKQDAIAAMTNMAQTAEREAAAELLLEAKGFEDCVVSITDGTADVVINEAEIDDAKRAQIEDIVTRKTEIAGENIVITPRDAGAE